MHIDMINTLVSEVKTYLDESQSILDEVAKDSSFDEDSSQNDKIASMQLVLQYRLSCENALDMILQMDHNLLYFLGIQPQHSAKMNLDRLAYAVGSEDLKQILNILSILVGSLAKIAERYEIEHASFVLHHKEHKKRSRLILALEKLTAKQKQVIHGLEKLHLDIKQMVKLQAAGPLFDHIAALRGPISQFFQAIAHGLGQAQQLYQKINKTPVLIPKLETLLQKADEVLSLMPSLYKPHPSFTLKQFDHQMTHEELEQRATAKRLRPFFG